MLSVLLSHCTHIWYLVQSAVQDMRALHCLSCSHTSAVCSLGMSPDVYY